MKTLIMLLAVGLAACRKAAEPTPVPVKAAAAMPAGKYVCPMKCAGADEPGKCPQCGMPIVERAKVQP
jgi:hypothetical protein